MAELAPFLERFRGSRDAEILWLQQLFVFVRDHLSPPPAQCASVGPAPSVSELSLELVRILQETCPSHSLPVSYRQVSVAELASLQRVPCVSHLSWTTNQHRAWVREAELIPGLRPLPRVNLLLIGRLSRGRGPDLRLRDATGELTCQVDSGLSDWSLSTDRPVFLPHWNYIPHDAPGQGLLELIGQPLPLSPGPEQGLADRTEGVGLGAALSVNQAATFLQYKTRMLGSSSGRGPRGGRVSVRGLVSVVCPLLDVSGTTFFIFSLKQNNKTVHVLVKESSCRLWWSRSVHVGQRVHVTELRACTLRGGHGVLSATDQSELSVYSDQSELSVYSDQSELSVQMDQSQQGSVETQTQSQSETEAERMDQSGLRRSSVISYRGTVTKVLSRGAGLYVMDGKVGLCLANHPLPSRAIRPGDTLQLCNVHLLLKPSADYNPIMLCCCLRSSVTVTAFSPGYRGDEEDEGCPGDGVLPRLLLQKNLGVSEYLWMCHMTRRLRDSLVPQREQCVCLLSWKILESLSPKPRQTLRRDIYQEMMDVPHICPLSQYSSGAPDRQVLSLSELRSWLVSYSWSSLKLRSLLPPDGQSLNCSQLNAALSWSRSSLSSDFRDFLDQTGDQTRDRTGDQRDTRIGSRPVVLVVLVELPCEGSESQNLQLRDGSGSISCVVTEPGPDQNQTTAFNTAWIGCLVCVQSFTMVTERFIQSEFPSFKHLDQDHFISQKDCRVYLQFSFDQVSVLSPSVSMATVPLRQGAESVGDVIEQEAEPEEPHRKRKRKQDGVHSGGGGVRPCVSVVIRAELKEGVAWRNVGVGPQLSFSLRAAVIGPVVSWDRDPKNQPITEREVDKADKKTLSLSFSGPSSRWFPLLQPGHFYRLVALDSQDCSVLIGCAVAGRSGVELHTDPSLQVRSDWRIHTVPRPQALTSKSCDFSSLSDVINLRGSDLVSFEALVLDRVGVSDRSQDPAHTGVRLTVCDLSGRSLQVYLDLSSAPFVPGLLPGNSLRFSRVQRKVSRSGGVYCSSVPVSCVSVVSVGQSSTPAAPPPCPRMLLGGWGEEEVGVAQVRGQVVCVLTVQLQWSCSLCDSLYTTSCSGPDCGSTSAVFQAKAKAVVEDGSAEAHVWFYSPLVQTLLRLDDSQWAGLQRALRVKGHIQVYPRGRSLSVTSSDQDSDPLLSFLLCCVSEALIGSVSLTCRRQRSPRTTELRRMVRGDRDFVTRVTPPLLLTCVHLETH